MTEEHIPDDVLFDYADDPAIVDDHASVERHLALCAECSAKAGDYRSVAGALREEETWWLAEEMTGGAGRRALSELVERWDAEDSEAQELIGRYLTSPYRFAYANITRKKRFYTGGVVRLLCEAARAQCDREPQFSLALADSACLIADALPDEYYPSAAINHLRGNAWKEYSTACRYLGQFDRSFEALDRAERAFRRLPDCETQLATVDLCRAALLWEQSRCEEGLRFARAAATVFSQRRDTVRYFDAREWEAIILHRMGHASAARETLHQAYDLAETNGDAQMKARTAKNLGIHYRDCGDMGAASQYFSIALQLFETLGEKTLVTHTRWSILRLALQAGNATEPAKHLPAIIAQLEAAGMVAHAARARLDLAEALLLLERFAEVHSTCVGLTEFFRAAKMLTGALTAAAYLKEASAGKRITSRHIECVRNYLHELDRSPDLPFAPPPEIE